MRSAAPGNSIVPMIAFKVERPTQSSHGASRAARTISPAIASGWNIGGTGCAFSAIRLRAQSNWGVFTAGSCTMVTRIRLPSCASSDRKASVNARAANFAAQ